MCNCWFSCNGCNRGYVPSILDVMSKGELRLFKNNKNVWLRKHNQRKFNQRMKWYEEMEKTGEMPDAMIQDMQDAAHRNAGHEPEAPAMLTFKRKYRHVFTQPVISEPPSRVG